MSELEPDLPTGYAEALAALKDQVRDAQHRARRVVNAAMIELYWGIGRTILDRQAAEPWGSKVLDRLARDLKSEFPHMKGFNRRNLLYMRSFAAAWDGSEPIVQTPSAQISWSHNVVLLDKLKDRGLRRWYAERAASRDWTVTVLERQIASGLHLREGSAPNNLEARLPGDGKGLAADLAKDPLVLDFLGLTEEAEEIAIEEAMTLRMSQTLAEFGPGFAFVGRQFHLDVDGDSFFIDLLLFHWLSNRFVCIEIKRDRFRPEHAGQLGFYVAAVDDMLRQPFHAPTVGILVCGSKNDRTVRYALESSAQPLAVSSFTYESLPAEEQASLPSPAAIAAALEQGAVSTAEDDIEKPSSDPSI
jgi:predicted nuclease of restriction endonuclease-like (RecB) superfamily